MLYFIERCGEVFNTKMNKLLFYTDFLSYKAIQFGPVPVRWDRVYGLIDDIHSEIVEFPSGNRGTKLCSDLSPDMGSFTEKELAVPDKVCSKFSGASACDISNLSHREDAWKDYYIPAVVLSLSGRNAHVCM